MSMDIYTTYLIKELLIDTPGKLDIEVVSPVQQHAILKCPSRAFPSYWSVHCRPRQIQQNRFLSAMRRAGPTC